MVYVVHILATQQHSLRQIMQRGAQQELMLTIQAIPRLNGVGTVMDLMAV